MARSRKSLQLHFIEMYSHFKFHLTMSYATRLCAYFCTYSSHRACACVGSSEPPRTYEPGARYVSAFVSYNVSDATVFWCILNIYLSTLEFHTLRPRRSSFNNHFKTVSGYTTLFAGCAQKSWSGDKGQLEKQGTGNETGTGNGNEKLASFPGHFDGCNRSKTGGGNGLGTRLTVRSVGRNVHD